MTAIYDFSKACRLRKRADYLLMSSHATDKIFFGGFMVVVRPNSGPLSRLGVTVTRKIGRAVARNRLKRLAREFFRQSRDRWPTGLDILFIASKKTSVLWPPEPHEVARLEKFLWKNAPNVAGAS
jgi:ribonuclease P protein component